MTIQNKYIFILFVIFIMVFILSSCGTDINNTNYDHNNSDYNKKYNNSTLTDDSSLNPENSVHTESQVSTTTEVSSNDETSAQAVPNEVIYYSNNINDYNNGFKKIEELTSTEIEQINVPIYYEQELLYGNVAEEKHCFPVFWPGSYADPNCINPNYEAINLMQHYPNVAWRELDDGHRYALLDTETGARLYLFYTPATEVSTGRLNGYPVIMTQSLSYSNFSSIKVGDNMESIIAIDSSAKYIKCLRDYNSDISLAEAKEKGIYVTTIHLLTDGILKYSYERSGEEGNYVYTIVDIEYHEDFKMEGLGGVTDYSIAEVDYVD